MESAPWLNTLIKFKEQRCKPARNSSLWTKLTGAIKSICVFCVQYLHTATEYNVEAKEFSRMCVHAWQLYTLTNSHKPSSEIWKTIFIIFWNCLVLFMNENLISPIKQDSNSHLCDIRLPPCPFDTMNLQCMKYSYCIFEDTLINFREWTLKQKTVLNRSKTETIERSITKWTLA